MQIYFSRIANLKCTFSHRQRN